MSKEEEGLLTHEAPNEKLPADTTAHVVAEARSACSTLFRPSLLWQARQDAKLPLRRTAYLDGVKGWAALLVYALHHQGYAHGNDDFEDGYGYDGDYHFIRFPFVRLFFSGAHFALAMFFLISGYALSNAPLALVQQRESARLADSLGSSIFRRWLRLFLPVIAVSFIWMNIHYQMPNGCGGCSVPPRERTYADETWRWWCNIKNFGFVFTHEPKDEYMFFLWTIPYELRGSMVVYASILAFARCKTHIRLLCQVALIFYFLYVVDGYYCGMFATGMLLCDIDLLAVRDELPELMVKLTPRRRWVYYVLLIIALYLGGVPSKVNNIQHLRQIPGWYYLSFLKPQAFFDYRWFFRYWAATLAMIAIPRIPTIKSFFETSFSQYLGKICFGFYMVHGPVLWTFGERIYAAVGRQNPDFIRSVPKWINVFPFPSWGPSGMEINYIIPQLILLPLTLWFAEIATKGIDEPCVRFAQWLFQKTKANSSKVNGK